MLMSVRWMNDYLDPPATEVEQGELLTAAGFPLEERLERDGDVALDFEMMSNRGDCTCHVGLAREIAAMSGRSLVLPDVSIQAEGGPVDEFITVTNEATDACPLYTARVIRDVNIGESPEFIAQRLTARGDIPRNCIVDASNFVLFEYGQPTHAFDLDTIAGGTIIIRMARKGESFLPLGEDASPITLTGSELVIADAEKPIALAGVKGGAGTAVTNATKNILLEAATFDPVLVRRTSRLHGIASDSSFRYERGVSPLQVNAAAERFAALILEHAGGTLCQGAIETGAPLPQRHEVTMRPDRCRTSLGQDTSNESMLEVLSTLGFEPSITDGVIHTVVPYQRGDIEREIDLVEEVARMQGYDDLPVHETITIHPAAPQPSILGKRMLDDQLVAEGFVEAVTHTLVTESLAAPFVLPECQLLRTVDDRDSGDTLLRPSILPSLLRVRQRNQSHGAATLRLFERGSIFHAIGDTHKESMSLGLLADVEDDADGLRPLLGVIERLVTRLRGSHAVLRVMPDECMPWFTAGAALELDGIPLGHMGLLADAATQVHDLDRPVVAAELNLTVLLGSGAADPMAHPLPAHPAIERDLSILIAERVHWDTLARAVETMDIALLECMTFVTTWRSEQIGADRKSVTFRLRFRSPERTLTHEEVDGPVDAVIDMLCSSFEAEIRT
jgi:phenylalanyl-tRNA synthetase beta chain